MFASKLLKVLETLPTEADNGGCVADTTEEKATMKENQNGILSHSNDDKEANSLVVPTTDFLDSNGYVGSKETFACDTKDMDALWKVSELYQSVLLDDISVSDDNKISASTIEDDLNEALPNIITSRRYGNLFACDTKDSDPQYWNTPELECSMIPDLIDEEENESTITDAPLTSGCNISETDKELYTEKRVKEYELPELMVCYKENNYDIVKNICMNNSWNNAQPGTYVSVPADDENQHSNTSESADTVAVPADDEDQHSNTLGSADTVAVPADDEDQYSNTLDSVDTVAVPADVEDQHSNISGSADTELSSAGGSKSSEEEETESPVPNDLNSTSQDEVTDDSYSDSFLQDLIMIFGSSGTAKWKHTNVTVRLEGSGMENSQQSKQPDQIPFEVAAPESQNEVSVVNEANNSVPGKDTDLFYNSKLGTEAIISDFNLASTSNMDQGVKNIPEPSNRSFHDLLLDTQGYLADGEASFSALGPESGQIIYSRRIPSFGSISDSSTTSSGLFAFPILQSERNSSPVRMGDVESRKHRSWKHGILCCRF